MISGAAGIPRRSRGTSLGDLGRRLRRSPELLQLVLLVIGTLLLAVCVATWPATLPLNLMVIPLVLGSVFLGPRDLPWFVVFLLACFAVGVARQQSYTPRILVSVGVVFILGLIVMLTSFRRSRLGVAGLRGESMLVDLRDRIQRQSELPQLPDGWHAETALRSAGGTKFAGDFVATSRSARGDRLDLCVVDVSGKGEQAGTRALLLSGCFSGLLGALPPDRFVPEANNYLLGQDWEEGFATAVHLSLDLTSGDYEVRTAGHPPAAHLSAGTGRWRVLETEGPIFGLMPDPEYVVARGTMQPGDVILLYTDGLVESAERDLDSGIDRLLGQAERMQAGGFESSAERLIDTVGVRGDDRALVLVHRRAEADRRG